LEAARFYRDCVEIGPLISSGTVLTSGKPLRRGIRPTAGEEEASADHSALAKAEQVKDLDDEPSRDSRVNNDAQHVVTMALDSGEPVDESIEAKDSHQARSLQPKWFHCTAEEVAIVSLSLVER
jgi:hypothetical protein